MKHPPGVCASCGEPTAQPNVTRCWSCYATAAREGTLARVFASFDRGSTDECWPWTGRIDKRGYGRSGRDAAHRRVYDLLVGPIPDGMDLDHRCHDVSCVAGNACPHRRCVNPAHLTPATRLENSMRSNARTTVNARKTECVHGHPFTPENTYVRNGHRACRACVRAGVARYKARHRFGEGTYCQSTPLALRA